MSGKIKTPQYERSGPPLSASEFIAQTSERWKMTNHRHSSFAQLAQSFQPRSPILDCNMNNATFLSLEPGKKKEGESVSPVVSNFISSVAGTFPNSHFNRGCGPQMPYNDSMPFGYTTTANHNNNYIGDVSQTNYNPCPGLPPNIVVNNNVASMSAPAGFDLDSFMAKARMQASADGVPLPHCKLYTGASSNTSINNHVASQQAPTVFDLNSIIGKAKTKTSAGNVPLPTNQAFLGTSSATSPVNCSNVASKKAPPGFQLKSNIGQDKVKASSKSNQSPQAADSAMERAFWFKKKSPKRANKIVNSTVVEKPATKEFDLEELMKYVTSDKHDRLMIKDDDKDESEVREQSRYLKFIESLKVTEDEPVSSDKNDKSASLLPDFNEMVNELVGDSVDDQIISGNVCSKIRLPASAQQPEVCPKIENVPGMTAWWNECVGKQEPAVQILANQVCSPYAALVQPTLESGPPGFHTMPIYHVQHAPFAPNNPPFKLCEFYRTTPTELLIQYFASKQRFNNRCICCGETPLHFAVRLNSIALFNLIALNSEVQLNAVNYRGETALYLACEVNNVEIASRLLDSCADRQTKTFDGESCMSICLRKGNIQIAKLIVRRAAKNVVKDEMEGFLLMASRYGPKEIVDLVLEKSPNVNHADGQGNTAISLAVKMGHHRVVESLLELGASVSGTYEHDQDTLLHLACRTDREGLVRLLLRVGLSVHARNKDGETPLHVAALYSSVEVASTLVAFNADIEAEDCWKRTPLYLAILKNKPAMVKYLLSHGASTKTVVAPLISALKNNELDMIRLLLSHGLNVNQEDQLGQTLFLAAVKFGNADLINLLSDAKSTSRNL